MEAINDIEDNKSSLHTETVLTQSEDTKNESITWEKMSKNDSKADLKRKSSTVSDNCSLQRKNTGPETAKSASQIDGLSLSWEGAPKAVSFDCETDDIEYQLISFNDLNDPRIRLKSRFKPMIKLPFEEDKYCSQEEEKHYLGENQAHESWFDMPNSVSHSQGELQGSLISSNMMIEWISAEGDVWETPVRENIFTITVKSNQSQEYYDDFIQLQLKIVGKASIIEIQDIHLDPKCIEFINKYIDFEYQKLIFYSETNFCDSETLINALSKYPTYLMQLVEKWTQEVIFSNYKLNKNDIILLRTVI